MRARVCTKSVTQLRGVWPKTNGSDVHVGSRSGLTPMNTSRETDQLPFGHVSRLPCYGLIDRVCCASRNNNGLEDDPLSRESKVFKANKLPGTSIDGSDWSPFKVVLLYLFSRKLSQKQPHHIKPRLSSQLPRILALFLLIRAYF